MTCFAKVCTSGRDGELNILANNFDFAGNSSVQHLHRPTLEEELTGESNKDLLGLGRHVVVLGILMVILPLWSH